MRLPILSALRAFAVGLFRSRASLCLAHLARRHRWAVNQQAIHRSRLHWPDRLFWVWLSRLWSGWQATLVLGWSEPRTKRFTGRLWGESYQEGMRLATVVRAAWSSTCRKATFFARHGQIYEPNSGETSGTVVRSNRTMGAHISDCLVP